MASSREVLRIERLKTIRGSAAFTSNGKHILFSEALENASSAYRIVRCNATTGSRELEYGDGTLSHYIFSISNDGKRIVAAADNRACVFDLQSGKFLFALYHNQRVDFTAVTPNDKFIITTTSVNSVFYIHVWNADSMEMVHMLPAHARFIFELSVTPDNNYLVSGSYDQTAHIWRLSDGSLVHTITHPSGVCCVRATNGNELYTGCMDGKIRLVDMTDGQIKKEFDAYPANVRSIDVSPDNLTVISCCNTSTMWHLWNRRGNNFSLLSMYPYCSKNLEKVRFHNNGKQVLVIGEKVVCLQTICKWNDRNHHLFGKEFRELVFRLMCVRERLLMDNMMVTLPMELWLEIFNFLQLLH